MNIPYRGSTGPLHLLVDSTGIEGDGEWHARKHPYRDIARGNALSASGRPQTAGLAQDRSRIDEGEADQKRPRWGVFPANLEVRAVEITGSHIGVAPVLPDLLGQIAADERIGSVTAAGAYDTRKCHDAIADRGAHAVIPPRKNAKPWQAVTARALARNEALRAAKYLGRALRRRWSGYHRRSRVETKMHCVKLLGQRLVARDFDRQVAELQVRIADLNGYTAQGIPVTKAVELVRPQKAEPRQSPDLCNRGQGKLRTRFPRRADDRRPAGGADGDFARLAVRQSAPAAMQCRGALLLGPVTEFTTLIRIPPLVMLRALVWGR